MAWTHIVLEAYCSYEDHIDGVPECCEKYPGITGYYCLENKTSDNNLCPYFSFNLAKSTIVLTDKNGKATEYDSFFGDLDMSEKEWEENEKEWINKWKRQIQKEQESE